MIQLHPWHNDVNRGEEGLQTDHVRSQSPEVVEGEGHHAVLSSSQSPRRASLPLRGKGTMQVSFMPHATTRVPESRCNSRLGEHRRRGL